MGNWVVSGCLGVRNFIKELAEVISESFMVSLTNYAG